MVASSRRRRWWHSRIARMRRRRVSGAAGPSLCGGWRSRRTRSGPKTSPRGLWASMTPSASRTERIPSAERARKSLPRRTPHAPGAGRWRAGSTSRPSCVGRRVAPALETNPPPSCPPPVFQIRVSAPARKPGAVTTDARRLQVDLAAGDALTACLPPPSTGAWAMCAATGSRTRARGRLRRHQQKPWRKGMASTPPGSGATTAIADALREGLRVARSRGERLRGVRRTPRRIRRRERRSSRSGSRPAKRTPFAGVQPERRGTSGSVTDTTGRR